MTLNANRFVHVLVTVLAVLVSEPGALADLAQYKAGIIGPADVVIGLTPIDFRLHVDDQPVPIRSVERTCASGRRLGSLMQSASYIVFVDEARLHGLTRSHAIEMLLDLLPTLVQSGSRVMLVSNGQTLEASSDFSSDSRYLERALMRIAGDPRHQAVLDHAPPGSVHDRQWRTQRSLHRLGLVLERFVDVSDPGVLIYFGRDGRRAQSSAGRAPLRHPSLNNTIEAAAAHGVRVYIVSEHEKKDELQELARATGGRVLPLQQQGIRLAQRIRADLGCTFSIDFDPTGLPKNSLLPVTLKVRRASVMVNEPGFISVRDPSKIRSASLLGRVTTVGEGGIDGSIQAHVIPMSYDHERGEVLARVQIVVPDTPESGVWDLAVSVTSPTRASRDFLGRIEVSASPDPLVLEQDVRFQPGHSEIAALAHQPATERVVARFMSTEWPEMNAGRTAIGPITLLQRTSSRVRVLQEGGEPLLAVPRYSALSTDRYTAFYGIVCNRETSGQIRVQRQIVGERSWAWPTEKIDGEQCLILRDPLPAGTLEPGFYSYRIHVLDVEGAARSELATSTRVFSAAGPGS